MTPILAAIPVDTLIWIVLLLIGAIGSIASNARKASRAGEKVQARPTGVVQRPVPPQSVPRSVVVTVAPPPPAPTIVPRPRPVAARPPPPSAAPAPAAPVPHGTAAFRGMFERGNLVRAIVAAEVLGPPKSLREQ